ncbi:unnamed protein product [Amoebophrya sp. A25]|nr:unnamed protein product [Amoebophrya sp. A25]|eukprot:GSA25T00024764001.1
MAMLALAYISHSFDDLIPFHSLLSVILLMTSFHFFCDTSFIIVSSNSTIKEEREPREF